MKTILLSLLLLFFSSFLSADEDKDFTLSQFAEQVSYHNSINIYLDEDIKAAVINIFIPEQISNVDLFNLFQTTVTKNNYVLLKTGESYYIKSKILAPEEKELTYSYKLKYNTAEDCDKIFKQLGITYAYLQDTNSFIFNATLKKHDDILKYLFDADKMQTQVMLKITIIEFKDSDIRQEGIEFGTIYKNIDNSMRYALNAIMMPLNTSDPKLVSFDFYSALKLLHEDGKVNVRQNPFILAKNNKSFKFEAVENIPYLVQSTTTQATNLSEQNSIEYKDVGLKINGKTFIYDDYITLDIDLVIEDLISQDDKNMPQTYKRSLISNTNIEYNKVLLLSGIKRNKNSITKYDIPYISNIPYIGNIFKYENSTDEQINITIAIEIIKTDK